MTLFFLWLWFSELKDLLSSVRQRKVSGKFYGTNMKLGKERKKWLEKYRKNYGFSQSFLFRFFHSLFSKVFRANAAITISLLCNLNSCWKGKRFSSLMNICLLLLLLHCTKNEVFHEGFLHFLGSVGGIISKTLHKKYSANIN